MAQTSCAQEQVRCTPTHCTEREEVDHGEQGQRAAIFFNRSNASSGVLSFLALFIGVTAETFCL